MRRLYLLEACLLVLIINLSEFQARVKCDQFNQKIQPKMIQAYLNADETISFDGRIYAVKRWQSRSNPMKSYVYNRAAYALRMAPNNGYQPADYSPYSSYTGGNGFGNHRGCICVGDVCTNCSFG